MKKVLYVSGECRPFIASGGLADVVGSLPYAFAQDVSVSVVIPYYSAVASKFGNNVTKVDSRIINLDWRKKEANLYKTTLNGVDFYFIDCPYYFSRHALYGENDDIERFSFFCNTVVEFLAPYFDIIHCHDWQAALIPAIVFNRKLNVKTVLTIHNIAYQGKFDSRHLRDLTGLPESFNGVFEWYGCCNLLKGGIVMCNALTTVSPTYAEEILSAEHGCGLQDIIASNKGKLCGILNGIDYTLYDSTRKDDVTVPFCKSCLDKKLFNKRALQKEMGLAQNNQPIFAMVTRFAHHKGLDLVCSILHNLLSSDVQFVVLGSGEDGIAQYFKSLATKCDNFSTYIGFNDALAKKFYAGADFFVMPSLSEPCGLAQMIACRYATIPIVRSVGGLKDSIKNLNNGLSFSGNAPSDLENAISKALTLYANPVSFNKMRVNCINSDFSWNRSALQYEKLYYSL